LAFLFKIAAHWTNFATVSKTFQAKTYLSYLLKAKSLHGTHSPFVYQLLDKVIYDKNQKPEFKDIEKLRKDLLKDKREISITDLGAGSSVNSSKKRKVKDIAKNSAKAPKLAQLLFRLVQYFQPENILELGTSLGISTAYLSKANEQAKVTTIEGCPETAKVAQENFSKLNLENVNLLQGNFDDVLPQHLAQIEKLDFVFIDGNHQEKPTIDYFEKCLEKSHDDSIFIFDDIHWSAGMEAAWTHIKAHEKVTVSLDLYFIGIVFFRKEQVKEDFVVRF
jgi:predicted O-methyltransferase YrrM